MRLQGQKMRNRRDWRNRKYRQQIIQEARRENRSDVIQFRAVCEYEEEGYGEYGWEHLYYYDDGRTLCGEDTEERTLYRMELEEAAKKGEFSSMDVASLKEEEFMGGLRFLLCEPPSPGVWEELKRLFALTPDSPQRKLAADLVISFWEHVSAEIRDFHCFQPEHPLWCLAGSVQITIQNMEAMLDTAPIGLQHLKIRPESKFDTTPVVLDCTTLKILLSARSITHLTLGFDGNVTILHPECLCHRTSVRVLRLEEAFPHHERSKVLQTLVEAMAEQLESLYWEENLDPVKSPYEVIFPRLTTLHFYQTRVSNFRWLSGFPALKELRVECCLGEFDGNGEMFPVEHPSLESLVLKSYEIPSLEGISNLSNLRTFQGDSLGSLTSLAPIAGLTSLESFFLENHNCQNISMEVFRKLSNLRSLHLGQRYNSWYPEWETHRYRHLETLCQLPSLESLSLKWNSAQELRFLEEMKVLEELTIVSFRLPRGLESLEKVGSFRFLKLVLEDWEEASPASLRTLPKLRYFQLLDCNNLQTLQGVEECMHLQHLVLYDNKQIEDISPLQGLKERLVELELDSFTQLRDISPIGACRHLRWLNLDNCFRIHGWEALLSLPSLQFLKVDGNAPLVRGKHTFLTRKEVFPLQREIRRNPRRDFYNETLRLELQKLAS